MKKKTGVKTRLFLCSLMEYRLIDIQPGNFFVRIDAQRARLAKFHISAARDIICIDGCDAAREKGVRMYLLL